MNTFIKFLSKNKFYTFVTVFGFAVSLMFVFIIAVYVKQELSVDNFHEKGDQIYILTNDKNIGSAYRIGYKIKDRYPEIEEVVHIYQEPSRPAGINNQIFSTNTMLVDRAFFDVFSFPLKEGERNNVFNTQKEAIISESFARKVFPDRNPVGETIAYHDSVFVTITGVMKDIKNSTIPYADVLLPIENIRFFSEGIDTPGFGDAGALTIAVLAKKGADLQSKKEDVAQYFKEIYWIYQRGIYTKVDFIPLREFYFSDIDGYYRLLQGNKSFVWILMTIGVIILLFAVFNYINLTVAQTGFRGREMATRSLVGGNAWESFIRLIRESIILIFVSLALGILLAFLCVSYVSDLLSTKLYLVEFFSLTNVLLLLLVGIVLGIICGIFPAYLISRFKPIDVVKGHFKVKSKMVFSKVFIVIQNVLTIVLITASIVIGKQVNHLIKAPLGYNTKNIILIGNNVGEYDRLQPLIDEWEALASVKQLGFSQGIPLYQGNNRQIEYNGNNISLIIINGDVNFFNMMGFEVLFENNLGGNHVNYLNEQAYKEFGLDDKALSIPVFDWNLGGKIKDFQSFNILSGKQAVMVAKRDHYTHFIPWYILIESQGDPTETFNQVKEVFERLTTYEFQGKYMDDVIAEMFSAQKRLLKIIHLFTAIAILISLLGLIAISTYFIRQRTKEIAVKKLLGSGSEQVMINLIKSFLYYVVIAFVIAIPISWYFMRNWLDDYSYRISLSPFYFLLAGAFCLLISALTVCWQSYRAAIANPVNALKNE